MKILSEIVMLILSVFHLWVQGGYLWVKGGLSVLGGYLDKSGGWLRDHIKKKKDFKWEFPSLFLGGRGGRHKVDAKRILKGKMFTTLKKI